ncbi:unnamed protein product, partial [Rotaria magnacalcarata]
SLVPLPLSGQSRC